MREVLAQLAAAKTRREATDYLAGRNLTKAELVAVARHLDVAVDSRDTLATLRRKLVESTVGVREDTAAFRDRSWR